MGLYTEEQIKSANAVSLEQYLRSRGEKLARAGREYNGFIRTPLESMTALLSEKTGGTTIRMEKGDTQSRFYRNISDIHSPKR